MQPTANSKKGQKQQMMLLNVDRLEEPTRAMTSVQESVFALINE